MEGAKPSEGPREAAVAVPAGEERSPKPAWKVSSSAQVSSSASGKALAPAATEAPSRRRPQWQWEHRTGFKDYGQKESERIEWHFQQGLWRMRMKSGKGKNAKPREVYFLDMIQFDPSASSQRRIRRLPELTRWEQVQRKVNTMFKSFMVGEERWWRAKSKAWYDHKRHELEGGVDPEEVLRETYRVESRAYAVVNTWTFLALSTLMVVTNSLYIYIDADLNPGTTVMDSPWGFTFVDNLYCVWFLAELITRYLSFRTTRRAFANGWFVLDFFLVISMILESWVLQIAVYIVSGPSSEEGAGANLSNLGVFRSFRLARLMRIARLFKVFPQLFVLVKGLVVAMCSLITTLLLLLVFTYIFAVIFKDLSLRETALEGYFGTVPKAIGNLFIYGALLDSVGVMLTTLSDLHVGYAFLLVFYIFLSNLTMLNMLIGVLCEVIGRVSAEEQGAQEQADFEVGLLDILDCYDINDDKMLAKSEFQLLMGNQDLQVLLGKHGLSVDDLGRLEELLYHPYEDEDGTTTIVDRITFQAFLDKVIQLRGGNNATVTDMVDLRTYLNSRFDALEGNAEPGGSRPGSSAAPRAASPRLRAAPSQPKLPGQVSTPEGAMLATEYQKTVLSQLSNLKAAQDGMRGEVSGLQDQLVDLHKLLSANLVPRA